MKAFIFAIVLVVVSYAAAQWRINVAVDRFVSVIKSVDQIGQRADDLKRRADIQ
jgi:hypothetical protein